MTIPLCVNCFFQSEKSRHILHLRQKLHDFKRLNPDVSVPPYYELDLSEEDKATLMDKCVRLLLNDKDSEDIEVRLLHSTMRPVGLGV